MDNFLGDLTDILRASGASYGSSCSTGTSSSEAAPFSHDDDLHWQFSSVLEDPRGNFGDPFSNTRDPFLHELDMLGSACFNSTSSAEISSSKGLEKAGCFGGGGGVIIDNSNSSVLAQDILGDDHMRRPCNSILLNMTHFSTNATLAMSPCDSPVIAASPSAVVSSNMINANTSKEHYSMDNTGIVQISSPRNPGLKRRKCQAKKYVCIPAPTAPNSKQSGEIVPCDLWAWRKYGQKPIKGSPYPRSYYRCSSSKGCPARKQVERSRTDPNMLVISYTSEHNHAWPTQRNALGRSTRYQQLPSKNNINANSKNSVTTDQPQNGTTKKQQEEQQEISNSDSNVSPAVAAGNSSSLKSASLKEEINGIEKQKLEIDDGEFSNGLTYKASKLKCNQLEDFFAELREVEADSLNLLYPKCFNAVVDDRESKGVESVDPFHLFDRS